MNKYTVKYLQVEFVHICSEHDSLVEGGITETFHIEIYTKSSYNHKGTTKENTTMQSPFAMLNKLVHTDPHNQGCTYKER